MSAPYYEDEAVTLYHGDSREFLPTQNSASVDCVITDPPYTERTHKQAKTNKGAGQGWEAISFFHRDDVKPAWHGGGKSGVWTFPVQQGEGHPTVKPLPMVADWVRLFTNPGDTILDPLRGLGHHTPSGEGRGSQGDRRRTR